ncbi:MAG: NAD(P)-binding domain-containing protein, partial [Betaproteobacteria bacterium]
MQRKHSGPGIVGVVGLGIMGGAFAKHLHAARFKVVGYDVAAARRAALVKLGGNAAGS